MTAFDDAPVTLTSADGETVYALDSTEQASALRSQLGPLIGPGAWIIGRTVRPHMAWRASVCVSVTAETAGMRRSSDFYDSIELPLVSQEALDQFDAGAKHVAGWTSAQPHVSEDAGNCCVVHWLHVWALDEQAAKRAARRIGKARESELLALYEPRIGVVGVDVSDKARELTDMPVQPW